MKLLQVVPDTPYMIWQLYVQMQNFRDYGIEKDAVILVAVQENAKASEEMNKFMEWTKARVIIYPDTRTSRSYASSIRPHLLAKYFKEYPDLGAYMYHDQDIIFRRQPEIDSLAWSDINYVARGGHNYTSARYLLGFKKYQYYSFCEICGIPPEALVKQEENCGGAQYILKNTTHEFWEYCEEKCEQVYRYFTDITAMGLRAWHPGEDLPKHHVQIWATDMYVLLAAMIKHNMIFRWGEAIDFCWPFHKVPNDKPIMHNAGITEQNEYSRKYRLTAADGTIILDMEEEHKVLAEQPKHQGSQKTIVEEKRVFLHKGKYHMGNYPFGEDHSYVPDDVAQKDYVRIIERLSITNQKQNKMSKPTILAVFNTTNRINKELLALVLQCLKTAVDNTTEADVKVVTCSYEPIPDNPFAEHAMTTPFRDLGHLNYVLQLKQIMSKHEAEIVSIHEHDVLYPPNYFNEIIKNFDRGSKYGVWNNNYIGMNETGYLDVVARHQPFSLLSIAYFRLKNELNAKVDEVMETIKGNDGWGQRPWCYLEPHNKDEFSIAPFTNHWPAIHVNMNHQGNWHTGTIGKNHHFTNHCEVCYEPDANGKVDRPQDWGHYRKYFTFDLPATTAAVEEK